MHPSWVSHFVIFRLAVSIVSQAIFAAAIISARSSSVRRIATLLSLFKGYGHTTVLTGKVVIRQSSGNVIGVLSSDGGTYR